MLTQFCSVLISDRQYKPACSSWSANDPLVQFQPGEKTPESLKFCCSLLVSALSNHRATKTPRCSILTLSLTAAGLSIFCVTRQNASKNRFHYIFINFNNKLLRMSGNFPETFQTFRKNFVLFVFYFHLNFVETRKNFMGKKTLCCQCQRAFSASDVTLVL